MVASISALLLALAATSCHQGVYEDLSDCPQGVDFAFEVQTPCDAAPKYSEDVKEAKVFAFDETGTLLRVMEMKELKLAQDFTVRTDFYRIGKSDFLVWAGSDLSSLDFSTFEVGKTKRSEIIVSLKRQADSYQGMIPTIYVGKPVDGALTQEDRSHYGTLYDKVTIHLTQITNRLHLTIAKVDPTHTYSAYVEDDNGRYTLAGDIAKDSRFSYLPTDLKQVGQTVTATIDMMRLLEGRHPMLVIIDETEGKVKLRKDLLDDLLLSDQLPGKAYDLACDHDFELTINFDYKPDQGTYVAVGFRVLDWNVVFRNVILK